MGCCHARDPAFESRTQVWREVGLGSETSPREVQEMVAEAISVPLRYPPHTAVEELDRDELIVRIVSTPLNPRDGAKLAEEVLAGVSVTDGGGTESNGGGA